VGRFIVFVCHHVHLFSDQQICRSVTANEYLVRALARKREWTIRQPIDVFLALVGGFPTRHESIQKFSIVRMPRKPDRTSPQLIISERPEFVDFALRHLSTCQHVVELAVEPAWSELLDLDLIAEGFPHLEHLKIVMTGAKLEGSLKALPQLKSLEITAGGPRRSQEFEADMLPWGSAESLATLALNNITVDIHLFQLYRFRRLRRLTHLNCEAESLWGGATIADWLRFAHPLETYECYTEPPEDEPLSPSLSRLRTLTVRTVPPDGNTSIYRLLQIGWTCSTKYLARYTI
jgi:hypothetical protein